MLVHPNEDEINYALNVKEQQMKLSLVKFFLMFIKVVSLYGIG